MNLNPLCKQVLHLEEVVVEVREAELKNQEDRVISNRREDNNDSSSREDMHVRSRPPSPISMSSGQKGCSFKNFMACKPQPFQEEDKVTYGTAMLKSEALSWWEVVSNLKGDEEVARMTWEEFKVLFNEKFCPRIAVKQLEEEFLRLEQRTMTVREYTTSFTENVRFAEYYVSTEERRAERYIGELKASIRDLFLLWSQAHFRPGHLSQDCKVERRERLCFICKSPNHIQANCPQQKNEYASGQGGSRNGKWEEKRSEASKPKGRVFQMTATEVDETLDVVTGIFLVNSVHARVLFD
ncbi:hypothetical protein L6452_01617 [Arctium lappa]|uniref:Uncharacterized protein n=1 Tax=Arctium lappa TaxID=4217 RepID=A0ACB9FGL1_ARCLA|nr:hypothetical protein L6452_01617 [Arctium lappa]